VGFVHQDLGMSRFECGSLVGFVIGPQRPNEGCFFGFFSFDSDRSKRRWGGGQRPSILKGLSGNLNRAGLWGREGSGRKCPEVLYFVEIWRYDKPTSFSPVPHVKRKSRRGKKTFFGGSQNAVFVWNLSVSPPISNIKEQTGGLERKW